MKPEIAIYTSTPLLKAVATKIVEIHDAAIKQSGKFSIALSGGNTPRKLYELLAQPPYAKKIQWKSVYVFWGDERYLPLNHHDNNSHMASQALLDHVPIPKENIFRVPVHFPARQAGVAYDELIRGFFHGQEPRFDLILLGLGDDGHTASLFPGTNILEEKNDLVQTVFIEKLEQFRVSFTVPLINLAKHIIFLVTGEDKCQIVGKIFHKKGRTLSYPAQYIHPTSGKLYWFLDKAAASQLK